MVIGENYTQGERRRLKPLWKRILGLRSGMATLVGAQPVPRMALYSLESSLLPKRPSGDDAAGARRNLHGYRDKAGDGARMF